MAKRFDDIDKRFNPKNEVLFKSFNKINIDCGLFVQYFYVINGNYGALFNIYHSISNTSIIGIQLEAFF